MGGEIFDLAHPLQDARERLSPDPANGLPQISDHLLPQPAGFIDQGLVHPDLPCGRHSQRFFHDDFKLLTSPGLAVSGILGEDQICELFVCPLEPCGILRSPVGNPADMEMAAEDGGGEEAVRRGHGHRMKRRIGARDLMRRQEPSCRTNTTRRKIGGDELS